MTEHGLIGKYKYYGPADLQTVRAILACEQLRYERSEKARLKNTPKTCKRCGELLLTQSDGKKRIPKEYCADCESFRGIGQPSWEAWNRALFQQLSLKNWYPLWGHAMFNDD